MSRNGDRNPHPIVQRRHISRAPQPIRAPSNATFAVSPVTLPIVAYQLAADASDGSGRLTAVSPAITDLVGYSPDEWIADTGWRQAIHPEDREAVLAAQVARLTRNTDGPLEYRLLTRGGATVWVRDAATITTGDDGRPTLVGMLTDITRQKELEIALDVREERFLSAFDDAGIPLGISDPDGRILRVNRPLRDLLGYDEADLRGVSAQMLIHPDDRAQADELRQDLKAGRIPAAKVERRFIRKDGTLVPTIITYFPVRDDSGAPTRILAQFQNITDQRRTEEALREADERYRALVERAPDVMTRIDRQFRHLYMNAAAERLLGIPAEQWVGRTARELGLPATWCDAVERVVTDSIARGIEAVDEFQLVENGVAREFEIQVIPETTDDGPMTTALAVIREMTESVLHRKQLEYQATHDSLTGLLNRRGFLARLALAIDAYQDGTPSPAVLFLDLDDFKVVNDNLGHAAGDQVLIDVAGRLSALVRGADVVARFGGDEFAIMIDAPNAAAVATTVARRILDACNHPFVVNRTTVEIGASIGIAVRTAPPDQPSDLLRWADIAMYEAKATGKHRFVRFESMLDPEGATHFEWEQALRQAIAGGDLTVDYQPMVDLETGAIIAREALARWPHPRLGQIPPETFVPFADEAGLASALTGWILRRACSDAVTWQPTQSGNPIDVIVNISTRQFHDNALVATLIEALRDTGLDPARLIFDVTEQALIHHAHNARARIQELAARGVRIVIDKFGSGYTSLICLRECPISAIKIDRAFIGGVPDDPTSAAIVAAVVGMARPLGVRVSAVGVESDEQARWLRDLGCDYAQGFAFGEPVPSSDIR